MEWRDTNGTQKELSPVAGIQVKVTASKAVSKVWIASPDINGGVAINTEFSQSGNEVLLTLPSLKYWDMLVLEY